MLCNAVIAQCRGIEVECRGPNYRSWGLTNQQLINIKLDYRLKPTPEATPLPISDEMWKCIRPEINYVILSKAGSVFGATDEIELSNEGFDTSGELFNLNALNIDTDGVKPELSLTKRPGVE